MKALSQNRLHSRSSWQYPDLWLPAVGRNPTVLQKRQASTGSVLQAGEFLERFAKQFQLVTPDIAARLPNFLIVSPPKTGSTWLATALGVQSSVVSIPPEKELHYFSTRHRFCDLEWYARQFQPLPFRGEATPTYASLPVRSLQLIAALLPDVKLVFLMRHPIDRAWSHARHTWRYQEANFAKERVPLAEVPATDWEANFQHPWTCIAGDYAGQLRRLLAVFPRDRLFVGFFDSIVENQSAFLSEIRSFLGIPQPGSVDAVPPTNVGEPLEILPRYRQALHETYAERTKQLRELLLSEFGCDVPESWHDLVGDRSLETGQLPSSDRLSAPSFAAPVSSGMRAVIEHEFDDDWLEERLRFELQPEIPTRLQQDVLGFDLYLFRNEVYALLARVGSDLNSIGNDRQAELMRQGLLFKAATRRDVIESLHSRYSQSLRPLLALAVATSTARPLSETQTSPGQKPEQNPPESSETSDVELDLRLATAALRDSESPQLLVSLPHHNVVGFAGGWYAIPVHLGELSLTDPKSRSQPGILRFDTLDELLLAIEFASPFVASRDVVLYESLNGYNLLGYGDRYFAVPESLGPVDLRQPYQRQRRGIMHAESLGRLAEQILSQRAEQRRPGEDVENEPPQLVGQFEQYNLVQFSGNVFAVPQAIGPVDLADPTAINCSEIISSKSLGELRGMLQLMKLSTGISAGLQSLATLTTDQFSKQTQMFGSLSGNVSELCSGFAAIRGQDSERLLEAQAELARLKVIHRELEAKSQQPPSLRTAFIQVLRATKRLLLSPFRKH